MVALRAEMQQRTAEQPPLHADLHQQGEVAVGHRFEPRDEATNVPTPAIAFRETQLGAGRVGQSSHLLCDALPVGLDVEPLNRREERVA